MVIFILFFLKALILQQNNKLVIVCLLNMSQNLLIN